MGTTAERARTLHWPGHRKAAEVMTPNPRSIRGDATVEEAIAFLVDTGYSAAPVIGEAGRAIGVISRTDVVVYDRTRVLLPGSKNAYYFETPETSAPANAGTASPLVRVADLMNPEVFAVAPHAPLDEVAQRMVDLNVHRLFVVDEGNALVGVISALDLLACLRPEEEAS
jgi:CBS domain-containing protein